MPRRSATPGVRKVAKLARSGRFRASNINLYSPVKTLPEEARPGIFAPPNWSAR